MAQDLSGRGMVGGTYRSGKYKGKTTNLTKKQVTAGKRVGSAGKPGIKKAEAKKATSTKINISDTSWKSASERTGPRAKGGIVVGKDGKPITGTVTLASGKTATYVRGKRVQAAAKKTAPPKRTGGGGSTGKGTTATPKSVSDFSGSTSTSTKSSGPNLTPRQIAAARRGESAARRTGQSYQSGKPGSSARGASVVRATGQAPSTVSPKKMPKNGETRTVKRGRVTAIERYNASTGKWMTVRIVRH